MPSIAIEYVSFHPLWVFAVLADHVVLNFSVFPEFV